MKIASLPADSKVIVYRRTEYHNDNLYNVASSKPAEMPEVSLIDLGLGEALPPLRSGFYYLWLPGQPD
jgi:protease IV